jgi:cysteine synthase B
MVLAKSRAPSDAAKVDAIMDVSQTAAEQTTRDLPTKEGVFAGVSSGGAVSAAIELSIILPYFFS